MVLVSKSLIQPVPRSTGSESTEALLTGWELWGVVMPRRVGFGAV